MGQTFSEYGRRIHQKRLMLAALGTGNKRLEGFSCLKREERGLRRVKGRLLLGSETRRSQACGGQPGAAAARTRNGQRTYRALRLGITYVLRVRQETSRHCRRPFKCPVHASASYLSSGARWHLCSPGPLGAAAGPVRCVSAARAQLRKQQAVNKCRWPPDAAGPTRACGTADSAGPSKRLLKLASCLFPLKNLGAKQRSPK